MVPFAAVAGDVGAERRVDVGLALGCGSSIDTFCQSTTVRAPSGSEAMSCSISAGVVALARANRSGFPRAPAAPSAP